MEQVKRKLTYRIYPSTKQANKMIEIMRLHQRLYNAALEQRIDAYRRCGKSLNYYDQARELTQLRAAFPEYAALNAQSEQVTLRRLDRAFQAFFRRVKAGEAAPGFPRFKAFDRFKGWGYAAHGDGWKFKPNADYVNGTLHLSGVGNLQARGRPRFMDQAKSSRDPGLPKTLEIIRKASGKWFASITFATLRPHRASGQVSRIEINVPVIDVGVALGIGLLGLVGPTNMKKTTIVGAVGGIAKRLESAAKLIRSEESCSEDPVICTTSEVYLYAQATVPSFASSWQVVTKNIKDIEGQNIYVLQQGDGDGSTKKLPKVAAF